VSENEERLVEYYFQIVEKGLKEEGIWGETVRRFPPSAIREAVRRIVERCIETYWPLENVDWRTVFEKLKDHGSVESFIKDLEEKREIPPSPEEEAREYTLRELAEAAARLKQRVLEEKEYEKLLSAHREVTSIRKKLNEVEKERDEWRKKYEEIAKKYVEETESLKREIESLKREIEKLKAAPPPPTPPPTPAAVKLTPEDEEKLEKLFKHILISEIGKVPKGAIEEFARELEAARFLPYNEAAKVIEMLAREIAGRERAERRRPPAVAPEVAPPAVERAPPAAAVGVKVSPPGAPISPMKFPRRLASEEIKPFWDAFVYELTSVGLNPEDYMEYFIRFRDAWYSNWLAVLRAFNDMIEDIKAGKPPREYLRVPTHAWKEIPRDPVLHLLWLQVARSMDQLIELLNANGVYVTPQEVTLIVKNEWKKGDKMSSWLKFTPREYLKKILGVEPSDP
jgi:hypothetical protein